MNNKTQKKRVWDQLVAKGLVGEESGFKSQRRTVGHIHPDDVNAMKSEESEIKTEIITPPGITEAEALYAFLNTKTRK